VIPSYTFVPVYSFRWASTISLSLSAPGRSNVDVVGSTDDACLRFLVGTLFVRLSIPWPIPVSLHQFCQISISRAAHFAPAVRLPPSHECRKGTPGTRIVIALGHLRLLVRSGVLEGGSLTFWGVFLGFCDMLFASWAKRPREIERRGCGMDGCFRARRSAAGRFKSCISHRSPVACNSRMEYQSLGLGPSMVG
jgi:hypothetical protein